MLALIAALLCGALAWAAAACTGDDTSSMPTGSGDNVHVDVDANDTVEMRADVGADSPFARVDGSYDIPDGYSPYRNCQSCKCPATDYCFGGGTGYTSFSGNCMPDAFAIGCQPLPPACAGDASCDCLLPATAGQVPCYAVCVQNTRTLYCPNP